MLPQVFFFLIRKQSSADRGLHVLCASSTRDTGPGAPTPPGAGPGHSVRPSNPAPSASSCSSSPSCTCLDPTLPIRGRTKAGTETRAEGPHRQQPTEARTEQGWPGRARSEPAGPHLAAASRVRQSSRGHAFSWPPCLHPLEHCSGVFWPCLTCWFSLEPRQQPATAEVPKGPSGTDLASRVE